MLRLRSATQNYQWGKPAASSLVAQLIAAGDTAFAVLDQNQPYAELWLGTHASGPSCVWETGQSLADWIKGNAQAVGEQLASSSSPGGHLPFLLKVLSVNKALSIQSHPNKAQAVELHARDPANYPDANHKPEMAIALTPFEMLCGFRPADQVLGNLRDTPELFELVGGGAFTQLETAVAARGQRAEGTAAADSEQHESSVRNALRACFTQLMRQPEVLVRKNVASLVERVALALKSRTECDSVSPFYVLAELLIRLNFHYPGDVGVLAPFFLNHFVLQPAEAAFLGANEPHAYLYGDCIECMATSDNTIRAGLTPKFKDVATLCATLTYRNEPADRNKFKPTPLHQGDGGGGEVLVYDPPAPEFTVHAVKAPPDHSVRLCALPTLSILLVCDGRASVALPPPADGSGDGAQEHGAIGKGHFYAVPAGFAAQFTCDARADRPFLAYRAFTSADGVQKL